jgi:hypothetical protein
VALTNEAIRCEVDASNRLEMAGFSAKSLVMAAPLEKLVPINDEQV